MRKVKITLLICLLFAMQVFYPIPAVHADPLFSAEHSFFETGIRHPVPFKVVINATVTSEVYLSATELSVTVDGAGNASHMGLVGFHLTEVIDFTTWQSDQYVTYTAANGDQLTAHAISQVTPLPPDFIIFDVQGQGEVTGGTGRFEGATGNLQVRAVANTATGDVRARVSGMITY